MENQTYKLQFLGKGSEFFGIMIVNWLLTLITLGLYYPWARAKTLKYIYGSTTLNDDNFNFAGTGKEMLRGFIKLLLFYIVIMAIYIVFLVIKLPFVAIPVFFIAFMAIIPLAIHGSYRYRMSRTSYRGIRFGYRGERKELIFKYIKGFLLTLITFGIYSAWFEVDIRKYVFNNVRYGDVETHYKGDGTDFFVLCLVGNLLTMITLGIYSFWYQRNLYAFLFDNLYFTKDDKQINLKFMATGGGIFKLQIVNLLIVVFTLGFGTPWVEMRTRKFIYENIAVTGDIDLSEIHQTEEEYTNAFGEDAMDFFGIDLA